MKSTRSIVVLIALSLVAFGIFAAAPQKPATAGSGSDKSIEAARLNNLGAAYMNQQLFAKASKEFEGAAALDPKQQSAQINRGIALLNRQRVGEAKRILEEAIKRDPKTAHAANNRASLTTNTSDAKTAA